MGVQKSMGPDTAGVGGSGVTSLSGQRILTGLLGALGGIMLGGGVGDSDDDGA